MIFYRIRPLNSINPAQRLHFYPDLCLLAGMRCHHGEYLWQEETHSSDRARQGDIGECVSLAIAMLTTVTLLYWW